MHMQAMQLSPFLEGLLQKGLVMQAGGVPVMLHVIADPRGLRPFSSSSTLSSARPSPAVSPTHSGELKRPSGLSSHPSHTSQTSPLELRALSSNSMRAQIQAALDLPDDSVNVLGRVPEFLAAMRSNVPGSSMSGQDFKGR